MKVGGHGGVADDGLGGNNSNGSNGGNGGNGGNGANGANDGKKSFSTENYQKGKGYWNGGTMFGCNVNFSNAPGKDEDISSLVNDLKKSLMENSSLHLTEKDEEKLDTSLQMALQSMQKGKNPVKLCFGHTEYNGNGEAVAWWGSEINLVMGDG